MNNKYTIKVGSPLLRPGLTITTEVSEAYVIPVTHALMRAVRHINVPKPVKVIHERSVLPAESGTPRDPWMPQDHERPGDPQ